MRMVLLISQTSDGGLGSCRGVAEQLTRLFKEACLRQLHTPTAFETKYVSRLTFFNRNSRKEDEAYPSPASAHSGGAYRQRSCLYHQFKVPTGWSCHAHANRRPTPLLCQVLQGRKSPVSPSTPQYLATRSVLRGTESLGREGQTGI